MTRFEIIQTSSAPAGRILIDQALAAIRKFRRTHSLRELRDLLTNPDHAREVLGDIGAAIAIVPGRGPGVCAPLVLGIAVGSREHAEMMRALRRTLIQCDGITKAALVVTDTWTAFGTQHLGDWRAFANKGVSMAATVDGDGMSGPAELLLDL